MKNNSPESVSAVPQTFAYRRERPLKEPEKLGHLLPIDFSFLEIYKSIKAIYFLHSYVFDIERHEKLFVEQ